MAEQEKKKADLSQLDLATGVDRIPELWNRHGNTVLIAITILALGYALYTFRKNSADSARIETQTNLATARELLGLLRGDQLLRSPDSYAALRRQTFTEASTALSNVLGKTDDNDAKVQALLLQGDLNYVVAMLPDPVAATTRPELKLERSADDLLRTAQGSYQEIVTSFPTRTSDVAAARLGLAAIAENNGEFDAAKGFYETVSGDKSVPSSYRETAKQRLAQLPMLSQPMRFRTPTTQISPTPLLSLPPATVPAAKP